MWKIIDIYFISQHSHQTNRHITTITYFFRYEILTYKWISSQKLFMFDLKKTKYWIETISSKAFWWQKPGESLKNSIIIFFWELHWCQDPWSRFHVGFEIELPLIGKTRCMMWVLAQKVSFLLFRQFMWLVKDLSK